MKTKKEEEVPMEEKVSLVQSILGNAYTPEKIEHYLLGADGDIQIALNHILATEANDTSKNLHFKPKNSFSYLSSRSPTKIGSRSIYRVHGESIV